MCRDRGIAAPGPSEPPPSLKVRACGLPQRWLRARPDAPGNAREEFLERGRKCELGWDGGMGLGTPRLGVKRVGIGVGITVTLGL